MVSKVLLVFCSLLVVVAVNEVSAAAIATLSDATRLVDNLKKGYETIFYPDNITLHVGITYVCAYMDEEHGRLSSRVVERYNWVDNRLKWDPKDYHGLDKISVPDKYIWTPDVHLQNAIMSEHRDEVNAVILHTGNVYWIVSANYQSRCSDHDDHDDAYHCELKLGSWTYDAASIPLDLFRAHGSDGFDTKMYLDSCPYTIDNAHAVIKTTKYDCCKNPYSALKVNFDVHKRKEEKHDDHADDDDDHHHGYKAYYSEDCEWPHC